MGSLTNFSSKVCHHAPQSLECLNSLLDVEEIKPLRSLEFGLRPLGIFGKWFGQSCRSQVIHISSVDGEFEDGYVVIEVFDQAETSRIGTEELLKSVRMKVSCDEIHVAEFPCFHLSIKLEETGGRERTKRERRRALMALFAWPE